MHENIVRLLMENSVQMLYVTNRSTLAAARKLSEGSRSLHCGLSTNEKIAYELALAGAWVNKRTACILSTEGLYDAVDPVMSSAYTGVEGSFVVVAVQENAEEITPLGAFSKLPIIVTETDEELEKAVSYAFSISEEYKIPVIVQAFPGGYSGVTAGAPQGAGTDRKSAFLRREQGRWAATPKFRYQLHRELNEKITKIRDAFETYEGNVVIPGGSTGLVTDKFSRLEFYDEDASILRLATVFPLPEKLTQHFIDSMDDVLVVENYPAIELQIPDRTKVKSGFADRGRGRPQFEEKIQGFTVIRDRLGAASSINMAHGIKKLHPDWNIMAVTFEDHFFHSGMPAYVNSLYNDSASVLLIMVSERADELRRVLKSYGVATIVDINEITELARFKDTPEPVAALYRGMI
ncbi:MAG: Indolepyruvate ferredoxin oxidoreductase [Deltaproteobacteria bacterium]|nr:Indolepyruvate ferredoxin oxidoreductase [Deltaproteobacteria bacterium]